MKRFLVAVFLGLLSIPVILGFLVLLGFFGELAKGWLQRLSNQGLVLVMITIGIGILATGFWYEMLKRSEEHK